MNRTDNKTVYILREVENPRIAIGVLLLDIQGDKDVYQGDVEAALIESWKKVHQEDCWTYEDVVDGLPKEWNASLQDFENIYI